MNKTILLIIQGISGTVGFGILLFYGYSSKTALLFIVLLSLPYIIGRIAIRDSEATSIKKEQPKITATALFTFFAGVFGILSGAIAAMKIDKASMQAIMESKPFLVSLYLCFISGLIADTTRNSGRAKEIKCLTEQGNQGDGD